MIVVATLAAIATVLLAMRPPPLLPEAARASPPQRWVVPVLSFGVVVLVGPLVAVPLLLGLGGRALWRLRRRRREAVDTSDRVLETCELLAAEVAAGQPPGHALARAASAWPVLAPAAEAGTLGGDLPGTRRELAERPGASELRRVGAAWEVAHRSGSGLGDALARVAATVRADRATRRVVESELASARATARLVAALPILVLLLGAGATTSPWTFLVATPVGWGCLMGGLALGMAGIYWIERIAAGVVG
ncbi:MAG: type II secretion system F family protein [Nocardioides sp.]